MVPGRVFGWSIQQRLWTAADRRQLRAACMWPVLPGCFVLKVGVIPLRNTVQTSLLGSLLTCTISHEPALEHYQLGNQSLVMRWLKTWLHRGKEVQSASFTALAQFGISFGGYFVSRIDASVLMVSTVSRLIPSRAVALSLRF